MNKAPVMRIIAGRMIWTPLRWEALIMNYLLLWPKFGIIDYSSQAHARQTHTRPTLLTDSSQSYYMGCGECVVQITWDMCECDIDVLCINTGTDN